MINGRISLILYLYFMLRIITLLCVMCSLHSCKNQSEFFMKMNGDWKMYVQEGQMQECWKMIDENNYNGKCLLMNNEDTLFFETMKIHKMNDRFYYSTLFVSNGVLHETDFILKKMNNKKLIFENKLHDFPQTIAYIFYSPDSMLAKIGGIEKDTLRYEYFPMKKISK
jgi:hypothetical protein